MASEPSERRAALRALLVEQAAASARPRVRVRDVEPGRLRMAIVTGSVAVAVVAASVVALQLPGSGFLAAPAGGTTPSPAVTAASPSPSPTTTLPPVADPTPTGSPATEAPAPDPSPLSSGPATTPPPTSAPPAELITPAGFQRLTRAELHAYVEQQGFSAIWEEQAWLDIGCMAEHGFVYDPIAEASAPVRWGNGLTSAQQQAYEAAMYGPPTDQPYDWRTAGCHGLSVHETGQDNAN